MVGLAHLVNDMHSKEDQGLMGVSRHPSGRKRVVRANADRLVPFSPSFPGSLQLATVALMAGFPVLRLAILAAVLHNFALAALLQDGRVGLVPSVSTAVGAFVHHKFIGSNAGSHA